ncbi:hypothetical protein FOZ63_027106, partial [Perkinsus olseni]
MLNIIVVADGGGSVRRGPGKVLGLVSAWQSGASPIGSSQPWQRSRVDEMEHGLATDAPVDVVGGQKRKNWEELLEENRAKSAEANDEAGGLVTARCIPEGGAAGDAVTLTFHFETVQDARKFEEKWGGPLPARSSAPPKLTGAVAVIQSRYVPGFSANGGALEGRHWVVKADGVPGVTQALPLIAARPQSAPRHYRAGLLHVQ